MGASDDRTAYLLTNLQTAGQRRRELDGHLAPLRAACRVAHATGATLAAIANAADGAVSKQAIHGLLGRTEQTVAEQAWQDAGQPDADSALEAVKTAAAVVKAHAPERAKVASDTTTWMTYALRENVPPTRIAEASGYSNKAAWDLIALIRLRDQVREILRKAGLRDADAETWDPVIVSPDGPVSLIVNGRESAAIRGGEDALAASVVSVAAQAAAALDAAGLHVDEEPLSRGLECKVLRKGEAG